MKKTCLAVMILSASGNAAASAYIGGGIGSVDHDFFGFDKPTGFELMVGTEISPNISIEASYVDFGEADDGIVPVWRITANTLAFGALASMPLNNGVDVFFKFGLHLWDAELREDGFGLIDQDDGTDILYGFGGRFKIDNQISVGARYTNYDFDDVDYSLFSVNAQIDF